jgi:hypothetical protein
MVATSAKEVPISVVFVENILIFFEKNAKSACARALFVHKKGAISFHHEAVNYSLGIRFFGAWWKVSRAVAIREQHRFR